TSTRSSQSTPSSWQRRPCSMESSSRRIRVTSRGLPHTSPPSLCCQREFRRPFCNLRDAVRSLSDAPGALEAKLDLVRSHAIASETRAAGKKSDAAELLEITRYTLDRMIRRLSMPL